MSVRYAALSDVPQMLEIYRPYVEHTAISFEYETPSLEEFEKRFKEYTALCPWLVWEENGQVVGYAYAAPAFERKAYAWCADLSIYLREDQRRKGIGRMLYTELENLLEKQGYRVLYTLVTTANKPSSAFHEAMGYRKAAEFPNCGWKHGKWHGVIWYEKDIGDNTPPSDFPIPFHSL